MIFASDLHRTCFILYIKEVVVETNVFTLHFSPVVKNRLWVTLAAFFECLGILKMPFCRSKMPFKKSFPFFRLFEENKKKFFSLTDRFQTLRIADDEEGRRVVAVWRNGEPQKKGKKFFLDRHDEISESIHVRQNCWIKIVLNNSKAHQLWPERCKAEYLKKLICIIPSQTACVDRPG